MSERGALPAPSRQSDPDRGRLALSGQRRLQPGGGRARRRDGPARARRGPPGHLPSHRRALGERRRRLVGRRRAAARSRATASPASNGGSRTRASSGSTELDRWVITCTAYGPAGPAVFLATTEDFTTVERYGIVRRPEDKNAALLPHRIDGRWVLLHRPKTRVRRRPRRDLPLPLGRPRQLEHARAGAPAARRRLVGLAAHRHRAAAAPDRARLAARLPRRQGHGRRRDLPGRPRPARPRRADAGPAPAARRGSSAPLAPYERTGDVPNVVFPCGLVHDAASDELRLYYGAADSSICLATARLDDLLEAVLAAPPDGAGLTPAPDDAR